jgi:hypothetical protein
MSTKEKLESIRLESRQRRLFGCQNLLGDTGRQLKAEVYADVLRRHPNALSSGRFGRVVRAVNNLIAV